MNDVERREAARQFVNKWQGKGQEDQDDRTFWLEFLMQVLGMDHATDRIDFQKKVSINNHIKKIDAYIPETNVLIEQKSINKKLDEKITQSGGIELTPFEQAERYNNGLPYDEKARWIVTSNFQEIWIYDMNVGEKERKPVKIELLEIPQKLHTFDFLIKKEIKQISNEVQVSVEAGNIVGEIYDAFLEKYGDNPTDEDFKELNKLCVRLVFCLYAEDSDLFNDNAFYNYLSGFNTDNMNMALSELFEVLDTPEDNRKKFLKEELKAFPYVNGELFKEKIDIPPFTDKIRELLLIRASQNFDWSQISPTIFGAVFESTLNPETRRSGGMHYTSIENIHKVIDPLFLDELKEEYKSILEYKQLKVRRDKLREFQDKLASLKFLDPAAGSGNFLTETFMSLRRLENKIIQAIIEADKKQTDGQIQLGFEEGFEGNPVKVSISQFYGIEINDFAVAVAKSALWIAENQMLKETEDIIFQHIDFLPLKTNAYIEEANALRIDWNDIIPASECDYIMGNPPFVGARLMKPNQKKDVYNIFGEKWKNVGNLDYVCCWYKKCMEYMKRYKIYTALVSTNSVSQGENVANLWKPLFEKGIKINFAYRTFRWDSEAQIKAMVFCVIIGFSYIDTDKKVIFDGNNKYLANNINGYLFDMDNYFVESRTNAICDVPKIGIGNKPIDGGYYLFTEEEKDGFILKEPESEKYFKKWYGSKEFINQKPRYCLWLGDCSPAELKKMPHCLERVKLVKEYRLKSSSEGTRKLALKPTRFHVENMPKGTYIVIPEVSSDRRFYIPIGFMTPDIMCSNLVKIIPNANLYHFGVLTSNVHMAWVRYIAGRLGVDYRYSKDIVYNNFPWPDVDDEQKEMIMKTAKCILDVREKYLDSSYADLYDPLTMPEDLLNAHIANDKAVMRAYGFDIKNMSETDCVSELMKMYHNIVNNN